MDLLANGSTEIECFSIKKTIQDLIQMMTQKTAGQKVNTKDISLEQNFDMTIITIVLESVALYLSGDLDKLER